MTRIIPTILFAIAALVAGDAPATVTLPADATQALKTYTTACEAADKVAEQAKDRARLVLLPALKRAQDAATKKGDLTAALAIKAEIEKATPKAKPDPNLPTMEKLAGRWLMTWSGGSVGITLTAAGAVTCNSNRGTYTLANGKVTINWQNGLVEWFQLADMDMGEGENKDGMKLNAHRVVAP